MMMSFPRDAHSDFPFSSSSSSAGMPPQESIPSPIPYRVSGTAGRIKRPFVSLGHTSSNDDPSFSYAQHTDTSNATSPSTPHGASIAVKPSNSQAMAHITQVSSGTNPHPPIKQSQTPQPVTQSYYHIPWHQAGLWSPEAWPLTLQWRMAWAHQRDHLEHPHRDPWKYDENTLYEALVRGTSAWQSDQAHFPYAPSLLCKVAKPLSHDAQESSHRQSRAAHTASQEPCHIEVMFQYLPNHDADRFTKGKTNILHSRLKYLTPSGPPEVVLEKVQIHILMHGIRSQKQLDLVLMHELGHAFGLWGHADTPTQLMWRELATCQADSVTDIDRHKLALMNQWHQAQGQALATSHGEVSQAPADTPMAKLRAKMAQGRSDIETKNQTSGKLSKSW